MLSSFSWLGDTPPCGWSTCFIPSIQQVRHIWVVSTLVPLSSAAVNVTGVWFARVSAFPRGAHPGGGLPADTGTLFTPLGSCRSASQSSRTVAPSLTTGPGAVLSPLPPALLRTPTACTCWGLSFTSRRDLLETPAVCSPSILCCKGRVQSFSDCPFWLRIIFVRPWPRLGVCSLLGT